MTSEAPIGQRILPRLVVREQLRLQVEFLERLSRIPECHDFALYGGSGLHGVYLHERLSDDLDLIVPPDLLPGFLSVLAAHGLGLEEREGLVPAYTRPGALGVPIGIGVDLRGNVINADARGGIRYECRPFGFLAGRPVPARVPPLADMLADKLNCITLRARAVDFVDLWLGLRRGPETGADAFSAFHARQPRLQYDAAAAWEHLASVGPEWEETLRPLMLRVADYEQVRRDLEGWLV